LRRVISRHAGGGVASEGKFQIVLLPQQPGSCFDEFDEVVVRLRRCDGAQGGGDETAGENN
jgi:hypothetical protein